jgi:hypothetical protein
MGVEVFLNIDAAGDRIERRTLRQDGEARAHCKKREFDDGLSLVDRRFVVRHLLFRIRAPTAGQ